VVVPVVKGKTGLGLVGLVVIEMLLVCLYPQLLTLSQLEAVQLQKHQMAMVITVAILFSLQSLPRVEAGVVLITAMLQLVGRVVEETEVTTLLLQPERVDRVILVVTDTLGGVVEVAEVRGLLGLLGLRDQLVRVVLD
jgi:hypothetical protein